LTRSGEYKLECNKGQDHTGWLGNKCACLSANTEAVPSTRKVAEEIGANDVANVERPLTCGILSPKGVREKVPVDVIERIGRVLEGDMPSSKVNEVRASRAALFANAIREETKRSWYNLAE
jgi:hypothetical protein